MKKILSFVLAFTLIFTSAISAAAADDPSPKEEVVYGLLNLDGSVDNLHVVNIFKGGEITDYGDYSYIRNMTSSEKINQTGEKITINTAADKFYYQGTLKVKELPWDIAIKYYLDDKEISASDIGGKSGRVKITVSVKQNSKINRTFFDNYALQIALSLDNKLFSNIKTENATIAEAGSKKQLAYTVLPGKGIDIIVTADVRDFEMDAISINGIKLTLGIDVDTDAFTGQISELQGAIKGLDNGAGELLKGLTGLQEGMQKYVDGMKAFNEGLAQLPAGAEGLSTGAATLRGGLSELSKQSGTLVGGALAIQQATFDSVNASLKGMGLPVLTPENYSAVLSGIPDLAPVKAQLDGAVQFTQGLKGYTDGVAQLGMGASELAKGTEEFKAQSAVIAASANELYKAGAELNGGIKKLREGLASYKEGTKKFRNGTSGMDSEIDKKIDEMLESISGKGDKVVSFVSEKNTNVSAVQFVLKTDAIVLTEAPKAAAPEPEKLSFWQKLVRLFSFINK
jgi:putative membrane protein